MGVSVFFSDGLNDDSFGGNGCSIAAHAETIERDTGAVGA